MESAEKVRLAMFILVGVCALLFLIDFIVHRHAYAPKEGTPGFYAIVGFLTFSFVALLATALRWVVSRSENYYAPNSVDAEMYSERGVDHEVGEGSDSNKDQRPST